jgi:hypothetical protein
MVEKSDIEIRRIFSDPNALRKAMKLWKNAEKRGGEVIREIEEKRKKEMEKW